jgi:hypothetical protein
MFSSNKSSKQPNNFQMVLLFKLAHFKYFLAIILAALVPLI